MSYPVRVMCGWERPAEYDRLCEWSYPYAFFDMNAGISHINGKNYYSSLVFLSKEDAVICKLMFPDIVYI